jgi:hypothetical protein
VASGADYVKKYGEVETSIPMEIAPLKQGSVRLSKAEDGTWMAQKYDETGKPFGKSIPPQAKIESNGKTSFEPYKELALLLD